MVTYHPSDQPLSKIELLLLLAGLAIGLFGTPFAIYDYVKNVRPAVKIEREYSLTLPIRRQLEQTRQEIGIIQSQREAYMMELAEMRTYGVRPTEKQILERAEMNMHGQTPRIEQRFLIGDYLGIESKLRFHENELRNEENHLLHRIKELGPNILNPNNP